MQNQDLVFNNLLQKELDKTYEQAEGLIWKFTIVSFVFGLLLGFFYDNFALAFFLASTQLGLFYLAKTYIFSQKIKIFVLGILFGSSVTFFVPISGGVFVINYLYFAYYITLIIFQYKELMFIGPLIAVFYNVLQYLFINFNFLKQFTINNYRNDGIYSLHELTWGIAINIAVGFAAYHLTKLLAEKNLATIKSMQLQNSQIAVFERYKEFAIEIENNNLELKENLAESDYIGKSLNNIKQKLADAIVKEEREKFLNEYNSKGITKISEILRMQNLDFSELSYFLVSEVVKYVNANQGAIFIASEDGAGDKFLELKAAYAYEKRKYFERKILPGEGVIGTAYIENKSVYMTKLPEDYLLLKSGLGKTVPKALIAQTISYNDEIVGILEIASLKEFEQYELNFIETISEYIASTIISEKSKTRTAILLEKSNQLTEKMRNREQELTEQLNEVELKNDEYKLEIENLKRMLRKL